MSEENVEIVRGVFEAIDRQDPKAVFAAYDRDVQFDFTESPLGTLMGSAVYYGHDGIRQWVRDRDEHWEAAEDECQDLIDAGDHVISFVFTRGRGRLSGVETELKHYGVWMIRSKKIVRVAWFYSREEALQAAGLSE